MIFKWEGEKYRGKLWGWEIQRSIATVQPAAITNKSFAESIPIAAIIQTAATVSILWRFLSIAAIASAQDDVFIVAGFRSATISMLSLLKHIYGGGFVSRRSRMSQKTIPIAAVPKNIVIDPMYSSSPKKGRNTRYIAAFFAPAAIVQFFHCARRNNMA